MQKIVNPSKESWSEILKRPVLDATSLCACRPPARLALDAYLYLGLPLVAYLGRIRGLFALVSYVGCIFELHLCFIYVSLRFVTHILHIQARTPDLGTREIR